MTERAKTFKTLLRFTALAPFTSRPAGKLSGGMKQKLGLACALIRTPRVLLLDEPSVGVDPISRRELWRMVQELKGEGIAVIWSTAYLDEAERCDSVLLLNAGKLLFEGKPGDLTGRVAASRFSGDGHSGAEARRPRRGARQSTDRRRRHSGRCYPAGDQSWRQHQRRRSSCRAWQGFCRKQDRADRAALRGCLHRRARRRTGRAIGSCGERRAEGRPRPGHRGTRASPRNSATSPPRTTSPSLFRQARFSACSGRTAPANRRRSRCFAAS